MGLIILTLAGISDDFCSNRSQWIFREEKELFKTMLRTSEKKIVIIAGPNGVGKTTFAREYLPNEVGCPVFVNADLIAAGLEPFQPEIAAIRAGRLMLREIHEHVRRGDNFSFESTLSGLSYARLIPQWRKRGYKVKMIYLQLPDVKIAIERVQARVKQGGHSVPEDVIRRRFLSGLENFRLKYKHIVDAWTVYDNSGDVPKLIEEGMNP
jgi:predicted ABC-type ATPase